MDMAGTHAAFAADAIGDWLAGGMGEAEALASYRQQRDEHASPALRIRRARARPKRSRLRARKRTSVTHGKSTPHDGVTR